MYDNDTICAPATAIGGALSIIRISGSQSLAIASKICRKDVSTYPPNTLHYTHIIHEDGNILDDVMLSVFHAPHSYTGEDAVEITCHGSQYIIKRILELLTDNGCRMAKPGEFTMRAYINGKMDLSQAEAVADLISSTNRATHQIAISQLRGDFSNELALLREQLLKLTSLLELELDFSDHEDLEFADRSELLSLAKHIDNKVVSLASSFETGQALKQGIPVAIIGRTNVGKSTLLNRLLKDDRAIVSNIHGTTRDTIEETIEIHGVTFRFIDTAGLRDTTDAIEQIGIQRTYQSIQKAQIILWLLDNVPSENEIQEIVKRTNGKRLIIIHNKSDIHTGNNKHFQDSVANHSIANAPHVSISAKYGTNIPELEELIYQSADIPAISENDVIITSSRHYEALMRTHESLVPVINAIQESASGDLIAEELKITLDTLAEITGNQITTDDVLSNIFAHFCVGK